MDEAQEMAGLNAELDLRIEALNAIKQAPDGLRELAGFVEWMIGEMDKWAEQCAPVSSARCEWASKAMADIAIRLGSMAGNYMECIAAMRARILLEKTRVTDLSDRKTN